jgi:excisionase family DNA binding protein
MIDFLGECSEGDGPRKARCVVTVRQAAAELMVSPALVYALVAAGEIEHERHGLGRGCIRISPEALQRYRESRTHRRVPAADQPGQQCVAAGRHIR